MSIGHSKCVRHLHGLHSAILTDIGPVSCINLDQLQILGLTKHSLLSVISDNDIDLLSIFASMKNSIP